MTDLLTEFEIKKSADVAIKARNKMFRRLGYENKIFKNNLVVRPEDIAKVAHEICTNTVHMNPPLTDGIGGCKLLKFYCMYKLPSEGSPVYGNVKGILEDLEPFRFGGDSVWQDCYIFRSFDDLVKSLVLVLCEKGILKPQTDKKEKQ